ncbi:MAG: NADH:flavin oxidoreductase [Desulfotomaculaceae bacterium]|nr:NADH:flavin oxidoreductase [Desulfotomaculaceae bacterium]MDD4767604.1 NADH:flavin oxidoreductase [Desulfotomaculaceae bacterium]
MPRLNTPFKIKNSEIKNRILRSATVESKTDFDGFVTDDLLELYYHLAVGGSGILITGAAAVEPAGKGFAQQICVFDDKYLPGLKKLADIVHEYGSGCKCAVQIFHQGTAGYGQAYGASERGYSLIDIRQEDIISTVKAFGQAARRVKDAGFDAVAVHGAHGYLLNQFLCSATNNRVDKWGGSLENRMRFSLEVYSAIRDQVGDEFPVFWKINTSDYIEGGNEIEQYARVAGTLAKMGVDLIELSGGVEKQVKLRARLSKEAGEHEAYFYWAVDAMKEAVSGTKTALAVTGGIRSLPAMEGLLKKGVDFIGLCRPLICEPALPNRMLNSPDKRQSKCTSCNKCFFHIARQPLKCREFDPFRSVLAGGAK